MDKRELLTKVINEASVKLKLLPEDILLDSALEFGYVSDSLAGLIIGIISDNMELQVVLDIQKKASILKC